MPSRRQIREAVIQLLYAEGPGGIPTKVEDAPSLALLLEPLRQKAAVARAKALAHLQQGRERVSEELRSLATGLADVAARSDDQLQPLADLIAAEQESASLLSSLQRELHGNKDAAVLGAILHDFATVNAAGQAATARLQSAVPDFPATEQLRADGLRFAEPLPAYRDRCRQCLADEPEPLPELKAVTRAVDAIKDLRHGIESKVAGLAASLQDLDALIAEAVDNYSPERLDRVDRAILRLATYEMLHDDDVPPPVAIDEAIELARSFGTTDSPSFVNGVLDRIHKATSSQSRANL